ncbi:MAG TPA: hypothetical protein PKO36_03695 [Candidatus Hydrogenedentes bacterium]|nr:hypothetical protein [Candidatus Hydrogenedentota bacterium]
MRVRTAVAMVLAALATGCLSDVHDRRPFTKEWRNEIGHDRAFQERRARIDKKDPGKLKADGGAIGHDRTDGPPLIGKQQGIAADVDVQGNAVVRYGVRW